MRHIEALRDRLMHNLGTDKPWIVEDTVGVSRAPITIHYRRPLRIDEVARLPADDPRVRERAGRP